MSHIPLILIQRGLMMMCVCVGGANNGLGLACMQKTVLCLSGWAFIITAYG